MKRPIVCSLGSFPLAFRTQLALLVLSLTAATLLLPMGSGRLLLPLQEAAAQTSPDVFPGASWERVADPGAVGYSAQALEAVSAYAETIPTTGLMVVVGGRVLLDYGDVQEISYLASVRKSILSMLYGNYVEDGTSRPGTWPGWGI